MVATENEINERDPILDLPTLQLGDIPDNEPESKPISPKPETTLPPVDSPQEEVGKVKGRTRPKVLDGIQIVSPKEQEEVTKSQRMKVEEDAKKAARKKARTAKAKAKAKAKGKVRNNKSIKVKETRKSKLAKVKAQAAANKNKSTADEQAEDSQQDDKTIRKAKQPRKSDALPGVKGEKRTRKQVEVQQDNKPKRKAASKAKPVPPKKQESKEGAKKEVDPEVKKARSRKSSAYHKAYKAALADGLNEVEAKVKGKEVSLTAWGYDIGSFCF